GADDVEQHAQVGQLVDAGLVEDVQARVALEAATARGAPGRQVAGEVLGQQHGAVRGGDDDVVEQGRLAARLAEAHGARRVGRVLDGVDDDAVDRGGDRGADDLGAYPVGGVGLDRERQLHGGDLRRAVDEDRAREVAVAAAGVAV